VRADTKQQLENLLSHVLSDSSDPSLESEPAPKFFTRDGIGFELRNEFHESYEKAVKLVRSNRDWSSKFSEVYIEDKIQQLLTNVVRADRPDPLHSQVEALIDDLTSFNSRQVVYIPMAGIEIDDGDFQIGRVTLSRFGEDDIASIVGQIDGVLASATERTEEERKHIIARLRSQLEPLTNVVCARFTTVAEAGRARERAIEETRRAIDLLYYSLPALYSSEWRVAIGLLGEVFTAQRMIPVFSDSSAAFSLNSGIVGPQMPYILNENTRSVFNAIGASALSDILKQDVVNDFDDGLLRAVHWIANAQTQVENGNALLSYTTCLEVFFSTGGASIVNSVSRGTARLLGSNLEQRKQIKDRVADLYGKRSGVSHGGKNDIANADIFYLSRVALALTKTLISRRAEFTHRNQLREWLSDQDLS
jgi:hypothetical protein